MAEQGTPRRSRPGSSRPRCPRNTSVCEAHGSSAITRQPKAMTRQSGEYRRVSRRANAVLRATLKKPTVLKLPTARSVKAAQSVHTPSWRSRGTAPLPGQHVRSQGHDHCRRGQKHRDDERGRAAWAKRRYAIDFRDRGLRSPATAERPVDVKGGEQEEQQNERTCHECGHGNHSASEPLSSRAAVADAVFTSIGRATIALAVNISPALHAPVKYLSHLIPTTTW